MDPMTLAALIGGGAGLLKGIFGGAQAAKGQRQEERLLENRPEYEIPDAIQELESLPNMYADYLSEVESRTTMPGQERAEQQLRESTAQGVRQTTQRARSSTEALGAATELYGKELENLQRMELESIRQRAKLRRQAMNQYAQSQMQTGQIMGQYEDQAFRLNQIEPWRMSMSEAQRQQQAGYNTISSGLSDIASAGQLYAYGNMGQGGGGQTNQFGQQPDIYGHYQAQQRGQNLAQQELYNSENY